MSEGAETERHWHTRGREAGRQRGREAERWRGRHTPAAQVARSMLSYLQVGHPLFLIQTECENIISSIIS